MTRFGGMLERVRNYPERCWGFVEEKEPRVYETYSYASLRCPVCHETMARTESGLQVCTGEKCELRGVRFKATLPKVRLVEVPRGEGGER